MVMSPAQVEHMAQMKKVLHEIPVVHKIVEQRRGWQSGKDWHPAVYSTPFEFDTIVDLLLPYSTLTKMVDTHALVFSTRSGPENIFSTIKLQMWNHYVSSMLFDSRTHHSNLVKKLLNAEGSDEERLKLLLKAMKSAKTTVKRIQDDDYMVGTYGHVPQDRPDHWENIRQYVERVEKQKTDQYNRWRAQFGPDSDAGKAEALRLERERVAAEAAAWVPPMPGED